MKYGQRLEKDSVPEWSLHNLDYNTLKHEIKVHTTRDQATAIAIPGSPDTALDKFEEALFQELCRQHDRVGLFVISKSHELFRRLHHLAGSVERWATKYDHSSCTDNNIENTNATGEQSLPRSQHRSRSKDTAESSARTLLRKNRRYIKYEKELSRLGDELHALHRFANAQVVAFRKILKKFKKWTGSATLGTRFTENVLQDAKSFTRLDFTPLQEQYDKLTAQLQAFTPQLFSPKALLPSESPRYDATLHTQHHTQASPTPPPPPLLYSARQSKTSEPDSEATLTSNTASLRAKYWNEYEDGSEAGGLDDEYAIYIDPADNSPFPGLSKVRSVLLVPFEKARKWFRRDSPQYYPQEDSDLEGAITDEGRRLLGSRDSTLHNYSSTVVNTDSEEEGYTSSDVLPSTGYQAHYALPSIGEQKRWQSRETMLFWGMVGCFVASFLLLGISGALLALGRRKLQIEVDATVTLGVVFSLFSACSGVGMTTYRRYRQSPLQSLMVGSTFATLCILNSLLLVLVVQTTP